MTPCCRGGSSRGDGVDESQFLRSSQSATAADAATAIERAALLPQEQPELIAEELRLAVRALERLIGKVDVEDVLDSLFSGFCIGK